MHSIACFKKSSVRKSKKQDKENQYFLYSEKIYQKHQNTKLYIDINQLKSEDQERLFFGMSDMRLTQ